MVCLLQAQDSGALVDALVKKGVLSDQEAEEIRADLIREYAATPAGKMELSSSVTRLKLYGDARLRYQFDQSERRTVGGNAQGAANVNNRNRSRARYRLRFGAEYGLTDNFSGGIAFASTGGNDSTNFTFDNAFSKDTVDIDLVYLNYKPIDWASITVGRQRNIHTTLNNGYTWDGDTNPEGGSLRLGDFKFGGFYVNSAHGFYFYDDSGDDGFAGNAVGDGNDTIMVANQITLGYSPNKDWAFELTPGFVFWSDSDPTIAPTGQSGVPTDDLNVLVVDASIKHPLPFDLKGKLYGEYGVNLTANERQDVLRRGGAIGFPGAPAGVQSIGDDNGQFFVAGYTIGENKKKGDWSLDLSYAYFETYSWDANLADSDFNNSVLNGHGYGIKAVYNFTDFLTAGVNWRQSWRINDDDFIYNGLTADSNAAANVINGTQILQCDVIWKF